MGYLELDILREHIVVVIRKRKDVSLHDNMGNLRSGRVQGRGDSRNSESILFQKGSTVSRETNIVQS